MSGDFNYVVNQLGPQSMVLGNPLYSNERFFELCARTYTVEVRNLMIFAFKEPSAGEVRGISCYLYV